MSKRSDKRQSRAEARLRYGGTNDELVSILKGLKSDYKDGVKQARVGARMVAEGAKQALPAVNALYGDAIKGNTASQQLVSDQLRGVSPDSPFKAAVAVGQGGAQSRLSEALAMSGKELVGRRVDAKAGGVREVQALRGRYESDKAKTIDQLLSNAKQEGLYASTRYGELRGKAADRSVTKRGQTLTHKDRVRGQNLTHEDRVAAREKADAKAKKKTYATPQQQGSAQDSINAALAAAKKLKGAGLTRSQAAQVLLVGDQKAGIEKYKPLFASVGLDLAFDKHISKRNVGELHKRKYRVKQLGFPVKAKPKTVNLVAGIKVPSA